MAFEYIGDLLEEAVRDVNPLETRGRVEQVVGTIIRAVVPGVKVGELCLLRNPWEDWSLKAEVVGFVRNVALLSPLGNMQGISPATEVIPTGEILSVPVGYELLGRVVDGLGQAMDGGPAIRTRTHYPLVAEAPNPMTRKVISKPISLGLRVIDGVLTCGEGQRMGIFAAAGGGDAHCERRARTAGAPDLSTVRHGHSSHQLDQGHRTASSPQAVREQPDGRIPVPPLRSPPIGSPPIRPSPNRSAQLRCRRLVAAAPVAAVPVSTAGLVAPVPPPASSAAR